MTDDLGFTMPTPWKAKLGRTYLCDATGLSAKSVDDLVVKGTLPGTIEKGFVILTPGDFLTWWKGGGVRRPFTPITDIHRTISKEAKTG